MNDGENIKLESEDCALIIKKDMTTEIIIPNYDDDIDINWEENQNMLLTIAIAGSIDTPEFKEIIMKQLDKMMNQTACDGTVEPTCGSCCSCGPKNG